METTVAFAPKILSGIDVIDQAWGGLYRGGSYLVYGRAASGRGLLTLMFMQTGTVLEDTCLFISPDRPKDLMIQAASIGFNLRQAHESGRVKLFRIPPLLNLQDMGDEGVAKALHDLIALIRQHRPSRLVINDFTPFVQFRSYQRFRTEFIQLLEQIDSLDTTLMLVMSQPGNQQSRRVIEFMNSQMTGSVHIELLDDDPASTQRRLTLMPNIGHIKRQVVDYWDLADIVEAMSVPGTRMLPAAQEAEAPKVDDASAAATPPAPKAPALPPLPDPTDIYDPADTPVAPPPLPDVPIEKATPVVETPPPVAKPPAPEPEQPELSVPIPSAEEVLSYSNREAFRNRLQQHFLQRDVNDRPFLLLAMRMDRGDGKPSRPFDFEFILDLVTESLRSKDDLLADMENERLIVLLADSRPEEAQRFFARLKSRLREDAPQQADHLLHSVSAIVVPDGRPFQNAEEFLTYAMDEE